MSTRCNVFSSVIGSAGCSGATVSCDAFDSPVQYLQRLSDHFELIIRQYRRELLNG